MSQAHYLTLVGIKMEKPSIGPLSQDINIYLERIPVRSYDTDNDTECIMTINDYIAELLCMSLITSDKIMAGNQNKCLLKVQRRGKLLSFHHDFTQKVNVTRGYTTRQNSRMYNAMVDMTFIRPDFLEVAYVNQFRIRSPAYATLPGT